MTGKNLITLALLLASSICGAEIKVISNTDAAKLWQQISGGPLPKVINEVDDMAIIELKGNVDLNSYTNDVKTGAGNINTPTENGSFYKAVFVGDTRKTYLDETVNFFQFGLTHSNDHSVLSSTPAQFNNLQMGRSGSDYYVGLGDVAPSFSKLSTALGARGILAQKQIDDYLFSTYAGAVSESWEALGSGAVRKQFLRDVFGAKVETDTSSGVKFYLTGQSGADRSGSVTIPTGASAAKLRSATVGFDYRKENFNLTAERGVSEVQQETLADRSGDAFIADATWRKDAISLKTGYHEINSAYLTLSAMATPGVMERYFGVEWIARKWVTFGLDVNNTKNTTLGTVGAPSQTTEGNSKTARVNFILHPDSPDWSLSLQKNDSLSKTAATPGNSLNEQNSVALKYESSVWGGGLKYSAARLRNETASTMDSDSGDWQFSLNRPFNNFVGYGINAGLNYRIQDQTLSVGGKTVTTNRSINVSASREDIGTVNLILLDGSTLRPDGQPELKVLGKQLDLAHQFVNAGIGKLFVRENQSNMSDPTLAVEEKVAGIQYEHSF